MSDRATTNKFMALGFRPPSEPEFSKMDPRGLDYGRFLAYDVGDGCVEVHKVDKDDVHEWRTVFGTWKDFAAWARDWT